MTCRVIKRDRRRVRVGDLRDRITLQRRKIEAPVHGETSHAEKFDASREVWAAVTTTTGKTLFDGVGTGDVAITHEVLIRHDPAVTSETWIELADGTHLDVVRPENYDERGEFLRLLCVARGSRNKEDSKA